MNLAAMVGMPGEALRVPRSEWRDALTDALRAAFAYHHEKNAFYRAQCGELTPADVVNYED
ncbi:MAG: long-chain-fatty-acid---luciferin-component ligase, partial [Actinomycetota bacterium]|nr:long-chain-fatty-acid---luciferin-component ligase [Actinomycetota bacterium]